ncbi:hypothetical protein CHLRE_01g025250v5 [Chlamydomonas reinhardtii]|uniref:riboflavin kinase n=1 Tax=Chlamydomonas reinhardtii TaxID=3055 RepID=A0A2K3E6B3_CHLRE|nr:uncharacterized protein CHLRE_01g025250v5 [Chlamydomonas reinhardtii]PNW88341.1 hypothetical protein CHLRE_01g025250v5 [Chlamydomonas reinhardtii]
MLASLGRSATRAVQQRSGQAVACSRVAVRYGRHRRPLLVQAMSLKAVPVESSLRPASPRTKEIATRLMMAPGVSASARALVVGSGAVPIIDVLKYLGVKDITVVDTDPERLTVVQTAHGTSSVLGNDLGVRTWQGDFCELPAFLGPLDVIIFTDEPFGTQQTPREALVKACLALKPGGCVVVNSEEESRRWRPKYPPTRENLAALVAGLPVHIHSEQEVANGYSGILQLPAHYRLRTPLALRGKVVKGYGRGSRQMGTPTANIETGLVKEALASMKPGVYFGWAKLNPPHGWPSVDSDVHKMVLNVGSRPTVNKGDEAPSLECHILHHFEGGQEFYGSELEVLVLGFLRPEIKFGSVDALVSRIRADIATARVQLEAPQLRAQAAVLLDK